MRRIAGAAVVATVAALTFAVPEIGGIATWKWTLGLLGFTLFVRAGRKGTSGRL